MIYTQRRIPINLAPIEGEALDSWLDALAHRTQTSWGDLLTAVGLGEPATIRWLPPWMVDLTPNQRAAIHQSTGIELDSIARLTLSHYEGRALAVARTRERLDNTFPWGPRAGTRYCPQCLAESGGRWQLVWRLSWRFACLKHQCLLVDQCPVCRTHSRVRTRPAELIPALGRCEAPAQVRPNKFSRCGADLTTAHTHNFADGNHPVLRAQRWIDHVVAGRPIQTGLFTNSGGDGREVLHAIRTVAVRILSYAAPAELEPIIPADLLAVYQRDHPELPTAEEPSRAKEVTLRSPRSAAVTAVGVLAALHCLDRPDVQSAGEAMRWVMASMRARDARPSTIRVPWAKGITAAVQLAALGPSLKPSDQLRYRTATPSPSVPLKTHSEVREMARSIPGALWQNWSLPLSIPGSHQRQLRPALSVALLLVGAPIGLKDGVRILRSPVGDHGVSRVLQLLQKRPGWLEINRGLNLLAEHLLSTDVPIDYQRRRSLDYSTLLPESAWLRVCRETDTAAQGPARAAGARFYLQERVLGSHAQNDVITPALRTKIADFPYYLTPELSDALDDHAVEFLASQGVHGEPVHYHPSTRCLRGVQWPGANPDSADIETLHHHVRAGVALGLAARMAGVELEVARYLLTCYPTPTRATGECGAYYRAKHAYPRQRFIDHYEIQRKSLRDIAHVAGVSRQTMARLADDYKIDLRNVGRTTKYTIERDWFYTEYVTHGRPLPDLAREQGVSTSTMARWARTYEIPLRPRGGARNGAGRRAG